MAKTEREYAVAIFMAQRHVSTHHAMEIMQEAHEHPMVGMGAVLREWFKVHEEDAAHHEKTGEDRY